MKLLNTNILVEYMTTELPENIVNVRLATGKVLDFGPYVNFEGVKSEIKVGDIVVYEIPSIGMYYQSEKPQNHIIRQSDVVGIIEVEAIEDKSNE